MDVPLTSVQVAILLELEEARAPVFADTIAKKFGLSSGVIRYNISAINTWLQPRFGHIVSRPKLGYKLDIEESCRESLLNELNRVRVQAVYSPAERKQLLIFELLCSSDYQSLENLARRVSLSKATLLRELSIVEERLAGQQIFLQKRPRRGTRVVGPEIAIRHMLVLLILEVVPEVTLMKLIQWGIDEQKSSNNFLHPVQNDIIQVLKTWDLPGAMRLLNRMEDEFSLEFGDSRFLYLALYWAVALFRCRNGQVVSMPGEYTETALSEKETGVLRMIEDVYFQENHQHLPQAEALVFLLEIFSSPRNSDTLTDEPRELKFDDKHVVALADRLVEQVGKITGREINNPELLERMQKHLGNMLVRFKYNLPIDNPFANDVIRSYPDIWQATVDAIKTLSPELGDLSREETAFLAMYFVLARQMEENGKNKKHSPRVIVVCPTGGVSVWMLVSRLKTEIPNLEIVANVSLRELSRMDKTNVDAIITTARNVADRDLPVICVTPFLSEDDILKIKKQFRAWGYPF